MNKEGKKLIAKDLILDANLIQENIYNIEDFFIDRRLLPFETAVFLLEILPAFRDLMQDISWYLLNSENIPDSDLIEDIYSVIEYYHIYRVNSKQRKTAETERRLKGC